MMTTEKTLGELVTMNPAAAKVMQRYRLDYCCGGKQSLSAACASGGIDPEIVLRELNTVARTGGNENVKWADEPLPKLIQYVLDRYHAPLKTELQRLVELARKVEQAHADRPERPQGLADLLVDVREAVDAHLIKEEQILFPLIVSGRGQMAHMPVQVMIQEHEDHGQNLRRIRALTRDFEIPDYACASWRELYRSLAELETELMDHIHLENNILFPRALTA